MSTDNTMIKLPAPGTATVTSVGVSVPPGFASGGGPVTGAGTIAITRAASVAVSALAVDWSLGLVFTKSLSGDSVFTFSNTADGQAVTVIVTMSGSHTVTWPTVKWAAGAPPVQTASGVDLYRFTKAGTTVYGEVVQALA